MNLLAIGIGAGLVSALLFGVVITGSLLAMLLSFIAPLPIFIAALGWNHRCGLIAAASGGIAMGLALNTTAGLAFALGWALPAWWLAYLALLGRPAGDGAIEWYPLGRLLLWIAGTAALITLIGVVAIGDGSYEAYRESLERAFDDFLRFQDSAPQEGSPPPAGHAVASLLVSALPFFFAFNFVLVLTLNLWLAAKAVQVSGRLPRSWPFIPATAMPRAAIGLAAAGMAAAFLGETVGVLGLALSGALISALALQGLAVIHDTSRARSDRTLILSAVYVLTLLVSQIIMPLLALLGFVDVAFRIRSRFKSGSAGPRFPST
jgi:hypothetical protein